MISKADRLLVVVPASNEASTISAVVDECLRYSLDVLVIDDGSTDGTGGLAARAGAKISRIESRSGLGAALQSGFQYALAGGFDLVATLDGDGAHDPAWIPELVSHHLAKKADMTIGSRFKSAEMASEIPSTKCVANFFATEIANIILGCHLTDAASGMRLMNRQALGLRLGNTNFAFTYELLYAARRQGLRIEEYPIRVRYDSRELLCTQRGELLDVLAFASATAGNASLLGESLLWLHSKVESYSVARIRVGGRHIVMLPIREYEMYSFQEQSDWFAKLVKDSEEWRDIGDEQSEAI